MVITVVAAIYDFIWELQSQASQAVPLKSVLVVIRKGSLQALSRDLARECFRLYSHSCRRYLFQAQRFQRLKQVQVSTSFQSPTHIIGGWIDRSASWIQPPKHFFKPGREVRNVASTIILVH